MKYMQIFSKKISRQFLTKHETKKEVLVRFTLVLLVFLTYFFFVAYEYGAREGLWIAWLTWSAFVLGTPIASAGFLVDFPMRMITGMRMIFSEMMVWTVAISLNLYTLIFQPSIYQTNTLLKIFHQILAHPLPYWSIIAVSALGTFISIHFGDELLDKRNHAERHFYHRHKTKYRFILFTFLFIFVLIIYHMAVKQLGVKL